MPVNLWTREQSLVALNLYCQLPFGKMHKGNTKIIALAELLDRTPSAVAMKLGNFASLDPQITESGRKGLSQTSKLDKQIWGEFQQNPEDIGYESQCLMDQLAQGNNKVEDLSSETGTDTLLPSYFSGDKPAITKARVKQSFFRKAVLSSYEHRCCISGVSEPKLLVASHIIPWSKDKNNRLNPSNGLCLSSIHDKAFDAGLITVTPDFLIEVSTRLKESSNDELTQQHLINIDGNSINLPKKFIPTREFLEFHRDNIFLQ